MADVVIRSLFKKYGNHRVIENLNLEIHDGEFVTLLGPSGCGKTTLLRMIAGLEPIDNGELFINGKLYNHIPPQKRSLAMVFQSYALFPHMTVRKNICFGMKIKKLSKSEMDRKFEWVINLLRLKELENRLPREISGGQRQRVALARSLVLDPEVLLLDEPLSNLDAALRETASEELKRIHRQLGKTIIYVTHNQVEAMTMSERIALFRFGRIEQYDKPRVLYDSPATVFSAEFIGSPKMNFYEGEIEIRNNVAGIKTDLAFLKLDKEREKTIFSMPGRKILAGIRPQTIYYTGHLLRRRYTDTEVEILAELVENMGDRSLVVGRTEAGTLIRFIITREEKIDQDKRMKIFIDGRRIHVFDPITQLNIFR